MGQYLFVLPSRIVSSACDQISIAGTNMGYSDPKYQTSALRGEPSSYEVADSSNSTDFRGSLALMPTIPRITGK